MQKSTRRRPGDVHLFAAAEVVNAIETVQKQSHGAGTAEHEQASLAQLGSKHEALLHHDSVRTSMGGSRQTAAQREHIGAAALCGASWHKRGQLWELACPMAAHAGKGCGAACEVQVHDLMAIKLRGMHTPLNFVPETYNGMYKLLVQVDQALLIELLKDYSCTGNKRMAWEAALEASGISKGTDCEDNSNEVAAMFDSALEALLHHDSVRSLTGGSRQTVALREHYGAAALCGRKWQRDRQYWEVGCVQVHDLMAIKLRGMYSPLNFVPETYNGMYQLLAQVDQPLLIQFFRAFASNKKKLLAKAGRQQGSTIQEAALVAPDPDMHPDCSDAASPNATTLSRQAGQPLAPASAAACGETDCSFEAIGWPCHATGSDAAASLPPGKRPRRSAVAFVDSAPLGSSAQGTSTGRCPSAAAGCADTTASNTTTLKLTPLAAVQLKDSSVVRLGVYKGRARPAGRGWVEADALWEQAKQVYEGGGGDAGAMLPSSSHATAEQDSEAQEDNQVCRLLPDAGSTAWCADSSEWGPRRGEAGVAGRATSRHHMRAIEEEQEEAGEGQAAMTPASLSPSLQATEQPAVSSYRQRLQLLLSQQRCPAPSECASPAAASWDD
ncbi:hypothetical protein QJQ45_021939 [Haematococcus lacustris]|nr:hypothetical protein QJQ45_021939 [Haematococcus lacustris]